MDLLFAQTCGDEKTDAGALDKGARDGRGIKDIDFDLVETGELPGMFCLLTAVHVLLKVAHCAAGFILITGGTFLFLVGRFLGLFGLSSGCLDPGGDSVKRELF